MDNQHLLKVIKGGFEAISNSIKKQHGQDVYNWIKPAVINSFHINRKINGSLPVVFKCLVDKDLTDEDFLNICISSANFLDVAREITMRASATFTVLSALSGNGDIEQEIEQVCAEIETW